MKRETVIEWPIKVKSSVIPIISRSSNENMDRLMQRLETLSISIGRLNPSSESENDNMDAANMENNGSNVEGEKS